MSLAETDAAFFFGRKKETAELLELLARTQGRVVTLIGSSGVGKSSLVFAGLLSRLKSQLWPLEDGVWPTALKDSHFFLQLKMWPGKDPVKELAVAFAALYEEKTFEIDSEATGWAKRFRQGSSLADMLRLTRGKIAEKRDGAEPKRFVLYVDQGEELYTRAPAEEARLFSRLLAGAAESEAFSVLMSLRSDFYAPFQDDGALFGVADKYDVRRPSREAMVKAVRKPAEALGARFEDDSLPQMIASAAQNDPGALPLVSDLMQVMWERMLERGDGVLRWADQPQLVDLGRPLRERAEAFIAKPGVDEETVRRLFTLRLAHVAPVGEPVRRRARKSECSAAEWAIAQKLADPDQRLLTIANPLLGADPLAEVAHEQLLRSWPRLGKWLEEQRDFLIWRGETEEAAQHYKDASEADKSEALLMGLSLTVARGWHAKRAADIAPELRNFVEKSIKRRKQVEEEEQGRADALRQAELEAAEAARRAALADKYAADRAKDAAEAAKEATEATAAERERQLETARAAAADSARLFAEAAHRDAERERQLEQQRAIAAEAAKQTAEDKAAHLNTVVKITAAFIMVIVVIAMGRLSVMHNRCKIICLRH